MCFLVFADYVSPPWLSRAMKGGPASSYLTITSIAPGSLREMPSGPTAVTRDM